MLSVIIPSYNEELNIELAAETVTKLLKDENISCELIFVDDGSRDATLHNLKKMFAQQKCPVKVVSFSRNFGKEAAIYAGLCRNNRKSSTG